MCHTFSADRSVVWRNQKLASLNGEMAGPNKLQDDWIEKSFQLAYFILRNRKSAIETVQRSLDKFDPQRKREKRRTYWRKRHLKQWLTKVSKVDSDILQWLICVEANPYEKQQEDSGEITAEIMVIRFIKCLVETTTALSSFYVNVGLQRILHSYNISETQQLYEIVTDRHLGADAYRRAKSRLMGKLQERFGNFLRTAESRFGEMRFIAEQQQNLWTEVVDECLQKFTPWSTQGACLVPPQFHSPRDILPRLLSGIGARQADSNLIETNRFHAFLHPVCFGRLANAVGLEPPHRKLSLPQFFFKGEGMKAGSGRGPHASPLNDEERAEIRQYLAEQDLRRRSASSQILKITVDGAERLRFKLDEDRELRFDIEEDAKLIEAWTLYDAEELLLASHRIQYDAEERFLSFDGPLLDHGEQKFNLSISPEVMEDGDELHRATITLAFGPVVVAPSRRSWELKSWLAVLPKYAIPAVPLLALGWWMAVARYHRQQEIHRTELERLQSALASERALRLAAQNQGAAESGGAILSYKLSPDAFAARDEGAGMVKVLVPQQPVIIAFELAAGNLGNPRHQRYRAVLRPFFDHKEILAETLTPPEEAMKPLKLKFSVPSSLLSPGHDYTIDLTYLTPEGQAHEVAAFSFQTVKK